MKMKKLSFFIICFTIVFALSAGSASAWDRCYKDVNYTAELQLNIEGSIIRGQAVLLGSSSFPAPLTGYIAGGYVYFSIAYLGDHGMRFYVIEIISGAGQTWGIDDSDSSYYDTPHSAQIVPCTASVEFPVESGALE